MDGRACAELIGSMIEQVIAGSRLCTLSILPHPSHNLCVHWKRSVDALSARWGGAFVRLESEISLSLCCVTPIRPSCSSTPQRHAACPCDRCVSC